ncbi:hypothetical protein BH10BAC2_BH10BAC2_01900 [soil metagenome]
MSHVYHFYKMDIQIKIGVQIKELEIYIMHDQQPSCPKCLSRSNILEEFIMNEFGTQLCKCNNPFCEFIFLEQEDDHFSSDYWINENRD